MTNIIINNNTIPIGKSFNSKNFPKHSYFIFGGDLFLVISWKGNKAQVYQFLLSYIVEFITTKENNFEYFPVRDVEISFK